MSNAQSIREIVSQISRSATSIPGQIRRLKVISFFNLNNYQYMGDLPSTEHPVVSLHRVGDIGTLGRCQGIVNVSVRLCSNVSKGGFWKLGSNKTYVERFRVRVTSCIVVHGPSIENNHSTLGNILSLVDKVLTSHMRRTQPERIVNSLDLFNDSMAIRQILFIFNTRETVTSNNTIKFFLGLLLDLRICRDKSRKPLHNGGSLEDQSAIETANELMVVAYCLDTANHESGGQDCHIQVIQVFFVARFDHGLC